MTQKLNLSFDENLVAELTAKFDLRAPNTEALTELVKRIEEGNYDALEPLVLNLATGAGKTFVMAAFIEYLRRQGHPNVMVVTPTKVVQDKTVLDFTQGSHRYIGGFDVPPRLVTPGDVSNLRVSDAGADLFVGEGASTLYVFNVHQLFPPKEGGKNVATGDEAARRKTWKFQEDSGALAQRLIDTEDLVIIADESHLFGTTAKTFRKSLTALKPVVTVGLTASPDEGDDIVYRYPLWRAIQDGYVKQPVLVYRDSGYDSEDRHSVLPFLDDLSPHYGVMNYPHYFLLVFASSHDTVEVCKTNYVSCSAVFTPGHRRTPRPTSSLAMVSRDGQVLPLRMSEIVEAATPDCSATPLTLR
mgnify:CR=1 FL=1